MTVTVEYACLTMIIFRLAIEATDQQTCTDERDLFQQPLSPDLLLMARLGQPMCITSTNESMDRTKHFMVERLNFKHREGTEVVHLDIKIYFATKLYLLQISLQLNSSSARARFDPNFPY